MMNENKQNMILSEAERKKLIPSLRFPEFKNDGEWNEDKVKNLISTITPPQKLKTSEYSETGKFPIIDQSQKFYCGWTNDTKSIIFKNLPLIIFGDHTCIIKLIKEPFAQGADGIKILKPNKKITPEFLYQFLQYNGVKQENYKRHFSKLKEKLVFFPDIKTGEQQKIADFLSNLDELLAAHKQKLELLKQHKKGLMQRMFPIENGSLIDNGKWKIDNEGNNSQFSILNSQLKNVPEWRFPEFKNDGEWVVKKLGEVGKPLMCKRIFKNQTTTKSINGVPFYKIGTFGKKADSYIPVSLYNEYKEKYNFPQKGDILISASGTIGRLVIYDGSPAYFQDSNIVWLGHSEMQIINKFLFYCYSVVNWQTSDGGIIKRLYNSNFKNIKIIFPRNKQEQQKIADFLSNLDELITAQAEKIEQLERHKKGLMQKIFPMDN